MNITRHPSVPRAAAASRSFRWPVSRTGLGLALGVLLGASCNLNVQSVFTCQTSENCIDEGGEGGVCEPNNLCTFPDADCPSGKRWHERAAELASKCYEPGDVSGDTDSTAATAGSSGSSEGGSSEGGSSSSESGGSTTLPADGTSTGEPPATDGSSSGAPAGSCAEVFGGTVEGYELCEETEDSCMFNVVLGMTSCDALCMMFGSTCIEGFTNSATGCVTDGVLMCDDATTTESVCRCAKP